MLGETEPEKRNGHVVVCLEHYILVLGGEDIENSSELTALSPSVIWIYNLYTEQWKKHITLDREKAPRAIYRACAAVIESVVYVFGGFGELGTENPMPINALWKLSKNSELCFVWDDIATTNMKAPSPRCCSTAWSYSGKLWVFGGLGISPVGYLNDNGDFDVNRRVNNQLLCFIPSCNEWTNPKCSGSVPTPRCKHATTILKHTAWLYGGAGTNHDAFKYVYELNMYSLTWTQIPMGHPVPQGLTYSSLTAVSNNQLVVHGGAYKCEDHYHTLENTWILDLSTQTWRLYKSIKDHSRNGHTGITGLDGCAIIIGGGKDPTTNYDVYTTTFHVMLHPKSLQKLAMQCVFQNRAELPWQYLPKMLKTFLGITKTE